MLNKLEDSSVSAIRASKREPSKEPTQKDRPEGGQFLHGRNRPILRLCARGSALGACLNSRCSILGESDSSLGHEQVFSSLEYRSDAASAAECAGLRAERPCLAVYR